MTEEEARIRRFVGQYEPVVLDRDIALSPVETAEQLHAGLLLRLDDLRHTGVCDAAAVSKITSTSFSE